MSNVLELATYRLRAGVTEEQYLAASDSLMTWAKVQPGFISRDLVRHEDKWIDVVWWADRAAAEQALEAAGRAPEAEPFFAAVDMDAFEWVIAEQAADQVVAGATV